MNVSFNLTTLSFDRKKYFSTWNSYPAFRNVVRRCEEFPYYHISFTCTIETDGTVFTKPYTAYYLEVPHEDFSYITPPIFYKSWLIETPYIFFSSKKENQQMKKILKRSLFSFLDEIEATKILPLEEKKKPIISKLWIDKKKENEYEVEFLLKNQNGRYKAEMVYKSYGDMPCFELKHLLHITGQNRCFSVSFPSVFWRDHITHQLVELIRKRSKYRMRHLLHFKTYFFSRTFVPSTYRIDQVKVFYHKK